MKFLEFEIPNKQLNGAQLKAELKVDEVYVRDDKLVIGGDITEAAALAGIAAHIAIDTYAIHQAAKTALLAKLGLTADELKTLLS
jgi:hypothetical protein